LVGRYSHPGTEQWIAERATIVDAEPLPIEDKRDE
jgi:hypothetical protein